MEASLVFLTLHATSGEGTYSFVCPMCENLVHKSADPEVVALLRTAGVETAVTGTEPRVTHMEHPSRLAHEPPPFTLDDLIDFHFLLSREDWFSLLVSSSG